MSILDLCSHLFSAVRILKEGEFNLVCLFLSSSSSSPPPRSYGPAKLCSSPKAVFQNKISGKGTARAARQKKSEERAHRGMWLIHKGGQKGCLFFPFLFQTSLPPPPPPPPSPAPTAGATHRIKLFGQQELLTFIIEDIAGIHQRVRCPMSVCVCVCGCVCVGVQGHYKDRQEFFQY